MAVLVVATRLGTVCDMRSTPPCPRSRCRLQHEAGFSLLELLVAILLIDVALLGIVHTHALVLRQRNDARMRGAAVAAAASRIETLLASPCVATAGSSLLRASTESWSVRLEGRARELTDSVTFGVPASHDFVLRTRSTC